MPAVSPYRRRNPGWGLLLPGLASLVVLTLGIVGSLWLAGVPLPFWQIKTANPYVVRIPINVRPIAAHSRVDRADLIDPQKGWLRYQELPPQAAVGMSLTGVDLQNQLVTGKVKQVRQVEGELIFVLENGEEIPQNQADLLGGAILNPSAIIGRVVKRDKAPGLGFQEDNFFPRGTPEGISGATPYGMRSIVLEAGKLKGIHTLAGGARIDLLANVPLSQLSAFDRGSNSRLPGAALVLSSSGKSSNSKQTESVLLAQEALVLKPVYQRVEASTTASLTQGKRVQAVPVYEVALAVHPGDVVPLQSALSQGLEIICVAHSMQPNEGDEATRVQEPLGPMAPVTSRAILAYEILSYDYFEDAATRKIRHEAVTAEEVEELGVVTNVAELVGTVVKHDIPKGSFITRADLLSSGRAKPRPESATAPTENAAQRQWAEAGLQFVSQPAASSLPAADEPAARTAQANQSRPNIVGEVPGVSKFIPAGFKAVAIPWNRLYGAEHLQIEDVVDLTVTFLLEYEAETKEQERRPDGSVIERTRTERVHEPTERTYQETLGFRGEPWFAAMNARVIGPVGYPPPAAAARFLGDALYQGGGTGTGDRDSGPPIMFAIEETDQEAISAALANERAKFAVVIHSTSGEPTTPAGWKRIVLAPAGLAPFRRLTTAQLEQQHTRRMLTRLVRSDDPSFAEALTASELKPLIGRVLKRSKERDSYFVADDFLAAEVQPGLAADAVAGSSVFIVADQDIQGLERFQEGERVSILFRGIEQAPAGVIAHGVDLQRPIAAMVVSVARVLRASEAGQTMLEVRNDEMAGLQGALAGVGSETSFGKLVAIAPASGSAEPNNLAATSAITDFDPVGEVRYLEAMVGQRREIHAFAGRPTPAAETGVRP